MPKLDDILRIIQFGKKLQVAVQNGKIVSVPGDQKFVRTSEIDGIEITVEIKKPIEIDQ